MPNAKDEKPVGYASPPVRSRFKPGQSGNPSGRPKKTKSFKVELIEELEELTSVVECGQKVEVTKARAIAKAVVREATGGKMRAITALTSLFARDPLHSEQNDEATPEEQALVDDFVDREIRRRAAESSSNPSNEQKD